MALISSYCLNFNTETQTYRLSGKLPPLPSVTRWHSAPTLPNYFPFSTAPNSHCLNQRFKKAIQGRNLQRKSGVGTGFCKDVTTPNLDSAKVPRRTFSFWWGRKFHLFRNNRLFSTASFSFLPFLLRWQGRGGLGGQPQKGVVNKYGSFNSLGLLQSGNSMH